MTPKRARIETHRFRSDEEPSSVEAKILFDADKLDMIGAVGIARSFMIADKWGQRMYSNVNLEDYVKSNLVGGDPKGRIIDITLHTPNIEFENKFVHIPGRFYTDEAKRIAEKRLEFMARFYRELEKEFNVS